MIDSTPTEDPLSKSEEKPVNGEEAAGVETHPEYGQILDKLDPDEQEIISTMISYSGPLPPPGILKGYSEIYPEAADKIFGWAENEQDHRQSLEKEHMYKSFNLRNTGLIGGIIISLTFILGGFILILLDKELLGLSFVAPIILSLVTLFVTQRGKREKDIDKKADDD